MTSRPSTEMDPGLSTILEQVWPSEDGTVRRHSDEPRPGERTVESYRIIPSVSRARFILPISSRQASVRALVGYNRLRRPRVRAMRAMTAIGVAATGGHGLGDLMHISLDERIGAAQEPDYLLTSYLTAALGTGALRFAIGVRSLTPNLKPTLQAFTSSGTPVGYCKIGWNATTRRQVTVEAAALRRVESRMAQTRSPKALLSDTWRGRVIAVTAPLPSDSTHWDDDKPPGLAHIEDIASTGPMSRQALAESFELEELRRAVTEQPQWRPELRSAYLDCIESLRVSDGDVQLRFGSCHGDWVPWNVARSNGSLWVWDWEHYRENAAIGLDVLHWHVQVGLQLRGLRLLPALERARRLGVEALVALQGTPRATKACVALYVLEMVARHERMRIGGGGESPTLSSGLVDALRAATRGEFG